MGKRDRVSAARGFGDSWRRDEVTLFNYQSWSTRIVVVRHESGEEVRSLVQFGKPSGNRAICTLTGQVYQQTNGCFVATGRFHKKNFVQHEISRLSARNQGGGW